MKTLVRVEKYSPKYREAIVCLWDEVFPNSAEHNKPDIMLDEKLEVDELVFVAISSEQLVGACMAGYDGHRGWLYAMAVNPNVRRQGVGQLLVQESVNSLMELGCKKVNLQIRIGNEEVRGFYESLGFSVEERISMGKLI